MANVTLGGERLGSGNKNKVWLHNYERSTHDLSYIWKSTMASGTLVPFMTELALPGDTFDIKLNVDTLTHPTIGPLFGSWKIQLDVFQVPIRLYQGKLHMNMLGIGMDMSKVTLPQMELYGAPIDKSKPISTQQVNPSSIFAYLGINGVGIHPTNPEGQSVLRDFNAVPYLGYYDIYKNYYANKQEEVGYIIFRDIAPVTVVIASAQVLDGVPVVANVPVPPADPIVYTNVQITPITRLVITTTSGQGEEVRGTDYVLAIQSDETLEKTTLPISAMFADITSDLTNKKIYCNNVFPNYVGAVIGFGGIEYVGGNAITDVNTEPEMAEFPLKNIDDMRQNLLSHFSDAPFTLNNASPAPYGSSLRYLGTNPKYAQAVFQWSQIGLALKTYNSDLFNNWISTEWIDGPDGISAVTAVDTSAGSFTIDELNMSKKIYNMLNRIALSGGSYDDWLDAVYTHDRTRSAENPIYLGGLIRNLVFQEVISSAETAERKLGALAGRGRVGDKNKGGHIIAKVDEPSYLIGIVSLTPNIEYSQGNKWDMNLKTLNDLHKPALDEIGFQDLVTDQMAWFDTVVDTKVPTFKSAGKQPAWINYMTNVNTVKGNFAVESQQMYMVLNRRYGVKYDGEGGTSRIADLTTYIDPSKFNHIFADPRRDAQNFWTQIGVNIEARRKMSAKVIPNL